MVRLRFLRLWVSEADMNTAAATDGRASPARRSASTSRSSPFAFGTRTT